MKIRRATVEDLPDLERLARQFYDETNVVRNFDIGRFVEVFTALMAGGDCVIFLADAGDKPFGALGAFKYKDAFSLAIFATELFWFVDPAQRGFGGIRLFLEFERWAKESQCTEVRMVHLVDSMPDKLKHFYEAEGYTAAETHYRKVL